MRFFSIKRLMTLLLSVLLSFFLFSCEKEISGISDTCMETEQVTTLDTDELTEKGSYWIDNKDGKFICVEFEDLDRWEEKEMEVVQNLIIAEMEASFCIDPQFSFFEEGIPNDVNLESFICSFELFGDFKVRIAYQSEQMTSVVFEGMTNSRGAAHPIRSFTAYNFDSKGKLLSFEELHSVDDDLYDAFAAAGEEAIKEENDGAWPEIFESFSETFCSREDFLKGLREGSIQWFYTEEGVCFSYPISHALGDHKEAVVPYSHFHPEVPKEYAEVLKQYREIAQIIETNFSQAYEEEALPVPAGAEKYEWFEMLADGARYAGKLGYVVKDINGDEIPELFWVGENYAEILLCGSGRSDGYAGRNVN